MPTVVSRRRSGVVTGRNLRVHQRQWFAVLTNSILGKAFARLWPSSASDHNRDELMACC